MRPRRLALATGALALVAAMLTGCASQGAPAAVNPPASAPAATGPLEATDVDAWLDGLVPAALERSGIAGAAVSVVHNGEVLTERGFGLASLASGKTPAVEVDPEDTLFRAGSVSKLFTATAVMQLVERGDLDLDTDVKKYLDFDLPTRFAEPVTLRHLLTHTAGFEERIHNLIQSQDTATSLRESVAIDPPVQVFAPGTTPAYSNYSNALAGYLVELVSGQPFDEYVQEHILDVTGMDSSSFSQPLRDDLAERLSGGYAHDGLPAGAFEYVGGAPAGALSAPVSDMARFMLAHLGDLPPEQSPLEPQTLALMHEPALDADDLGTFAEGPRMAIGFFDESRNGERIIGHGGDTQFIHTHLQLYPDADTGIYVALNSSGRGAMDSHELREAIVQGFADRYFPGGPPSASTTTTGAEHGAAAAGVYGTSRLPFTTFLSTMDALQQTVVQPQSDGTLLVTPGPLSAQAAVYEEIAPWVWREVGGQRLMTMRVTDGQVDAISYEAAFTMLRLPADRSTTLVLGGLVLSSLVLLASIVAWVVAALRRRRTGSPAPSLVTRLTRWGSVAAIAAVVGWAIVIVSILGFQAVPDVAIRIAQVLQLLALLTLVPAVWAVVQGFRQRVGWKRIVGRILIVLALGGVASFGLAYNMLSPDITY